MKRRAGVLCALGLVAGAFAAAPAGAAPPTGVPDAVVSLGDSAISGEAGRWAGNTNKSPSRVDALGSTAYHDVAGARGDQGLPPLQGRPRSTSAAASSPRTSPAPAPAPTRRRRAPATSSPAWTSTATAPAASARRARCSSTRARAACGMVVVLIGANNFGFASVVQTCVTNWLTSPTWWKNYCNDDASVASMFTPAYVAAAAGGGQRRVRERQAGDGATPGTRAGDYRLRRPDVLLADPERQRLPLQGERLHAPDDRRLRRLEPRRRLGQRDDGRTRSTAS